MRIALAQVDTTVGDLDGVELLIAWTARASEANADVVVFPELAITGYPPEDLVLARRSSTTTWRRSRRLRRRPPVGAPSSSGSSTAPTEGSTTRPR